MVLQPRTRIAARGTRVSVSAPVAVVAGSLALGLLSLLLPSAPTYDPFAWIIWGREITQLDLNTVDGPSWKPLPVIVTTLTAPLGEASPYIWVAVARAGAIAGVVLAWMLAARLAGWAAGLVAAAGLALMPWWIRNGALGNSEGIMVALVFGAALCHLHGRRGWAFTLAIGAGLLRPEAWPFLGLYCLFLLWEDRSRLRWIALGLASLPVLWLGPELWGSGNAFRASDRAQKPNPDSPAFADNPALEVTKDAIGTAPAAAIVGFGLAALLTLGALRLPASDRLPARRDALTALLLGMLAVAWIALVAIMTVRGFSGNQRYLITPAALLIVVGAVGVVWAVRALAARPALPLAGAAAAGVALTAAFVAPDADRVGPTLRGVKYQAELYHDLGTLIERGGGKEFLTSCGQVYTGPFLVPQVAWRLGLHGSEIKLRPTGSPRVVFHVRHVASGWVAPPYPRAGAHVLAREGHWALTADCRPPA
jgi:heme/copper-type cytochrome/quinol oxidase subunit 4